MKSVIYYVLLLCSYIQNVFSSEKYTTYHLESFTLCGDGKEEASIYIRPWEAAIIRFGYKSKDTIPSTSNRISKCKISVQTKEDFGLAAVIEEMDIRATLNKKTNGWMCQGDHVRMSSSAKSDFVKLLDNIFPGDVFKSKTTEDLCGPRKKGQAFTDVGANANLLFTLAHNMEVFYQSKKVLYPVHNSFVIVITSFRHMKDEENCQGRYKCGEKDNLCIDSSYVCDEHFNCAFPYGGDDEHQCIGKTMHQPTFSTTTTIITTLVAIVGAGLFICCLFTVIMKVKSRNGTPSGTPVPPTGPVSDVSAPPLQRQHTLPRYEAVVMSDLNQSWKSSTPPSPEVGEFPPSYHALFPDGPPKDLESENTHTGEQTATATTTVQAAAS